MLDDLRDLNNKHVYAFASDGTYYDSVDTWTNGQDPDSCPAISSPAGLLKPQLGFGRLWCQQVVVRTKLVGALQAEELVTVTAQPFQHGNMWYSDHTGAIALFDDGTWQ